MLYPPSMSTAEELFVFARSNPEINLWDILHLCHKSEFTRAESFSLSEFIANFGEWLIDTYPVRHTLMAPQGWLLDNIELLNLIFNAYDFHTLEHVPDLSKVEYITIEDGNEYLGRTRAFNANLLTNVKAITAINDFVGGMEHLKLLNVETAYVCHLTSLKKIVGINDNGNARPKVETPLLAFNIDIEAGRGHVGSIFVDIVRQVNYRVLLVEFQQIETFASFIENLSHYIYILPRERLHFFISLRGFKRKHTYHLAFIISVALGLQNAYVTFFDAHCLFEKTYNYDQTWVSAKGTEDPIAYLDSIFLELKRKIDPSFTKESDACFLDNPRVKWVDYDLSKEKQNDRKPLPYLDEDTKKLNLNQEMEGDTFLGIMNFYREKYSFLMRDDL